MKLNHYGVLASLAVLDAFVAAAPAPTQGGDLKVSTVYRSILDIWLIYRLPILAKA